ncbi:tRNA/rRNA cytosine-C5-methylase RsmB [Parapedobacter pyrenivorans]|uniref:tRNA/rRNA cytosine-C5-methylase RsmB n=1 Tax=Parapedobacter pyrenivorans TaxID=1305674 RepID=A0A917HW10_9SPHI|nr:RsmB/NOP family class I SAM-dependent RNA methyltransferase [Parapedobacter pyrenivorans]GGG91411.1 tRNA/rRNA cytosine-C5-methylase RsmB [Parapedobacter pyrenivorans]
MSTEKRVGQQIQLIERLLVEYNREPGMPLARFLTGFYKRNRQMGAKDRRAISRLVYHYFRIGKAAKLEGTAMRLAIAEFLCSDESPVAQLMLPALYPHIREGIAEKIAVLEANTTFRAEELFPFHRHLSAGIDHGAFTAALLAQPDLFIRLRPGHVAAVITALTDAGISYRLLDAYTIALPNRTALDQISSIAGKYEIQDYSSQQTGGYFDASPGESWWDACAGAGGKSLLLLDTAPEVNLLVSDIRRSILRNLDERFEAAGVRKYRQKVLDLTKDTTVILGSEQFDGIILDAPCTGSGTWGRTPEMIATFDEDSIQHFAAIQRQIATQATIHLKRGQPLIYITCSVFSEENEQVVASLQDLGVVELEQMELLQGYRHRADSMFVARLIKC